jgi:tRNA1Val (adenine37-N6)-methyltransferase
MGNPYFRFKQFEIRQDRCAMPVTTEACVFGAWLADMRLPARHALDIGCGTGLLMGMVGQQWNCAITGIDIDHDAAVQAAGNVRQFPWANRLTVIEGDVRNHAFPQRFDVIFTNPPFYAQQLQSSDHRINLARHASGLTLEALAEAVDRLLLPGGYVATLLPPDRSDQWLVLAGMRNLRVVQRMDIRQTPEHDVFRRLLLLQEGYGGDQILAEMYIRNTDGSYSDTARALLAPYYLYL